MNDRIECVVPAGDTCGEGAVWCGEESAVYWTDINRFLIHRYDTRTQSTRSWFFDEPVVALSLTSEQGRWLVALGSRLIWWWPADDSRQDHGFVLPGAPAVRLNDGRADPLGNFWVGSMRNNVLPNGEASEAGGNEGILYRIAPDGAVTEWMHGLAISNTICWSPDGGTFYTADTLANEFYACDFDPEDASISNRRTIFSGFEKGMPDGSAIDADGYIWNCRFFGRSIVRLAPDGTVDRVIDMPVKNITTATFGGSDLKTLYVTSASAARDEGDRLAGSLWAIRTEVPGLPENRVRIPG
ncbi:SMP-30/gluconolactonase/LRE family protein [Nitratireductor sp. GCM10026969]|uniref:SMP-30/gluconolactonase/LRE family protein n=1 Tax=Nitratireductor sp. GCM10026969 TaxID=3252645 RepID=UPI00361E0707